VETPGGSGEAAEEIAKFLRKKFEEVNFLIAGEAKSAGTILVLSGDNIYMTDTGSLGPIDAQVKIGRSIVSAHDYKAWIDERKKEAAEKGDLNPFNAIMVAQISPGELYGVINSLEFAKDLVKEWLEKHKFKNWTETETSKKPVTPEMRKARACEVAEMFCDHTTWRTHGRSLK
jgi:ClpP class serine protease